MGQPRTDAEPSVPETPAHNPQPDAQIVPGRTRRLRTALRSACRAPGVRDSFLAGLVSAVGWILAFPPFSWWGASLVAVLPLVWAADRAGVRGRSALGCALAAGLGTLPAWAWLTRWAAVGSVAGYPFLVAYLGLFIVIAVWATARLRGRWPRLPLWVSAPVVWVGVEYLRGRIAFDGFPWFLAAHPLIDARPTPDGSLAWPAAFAGTYAVSGLLVFTAAWMVGLRNRWGSARSWIAGAVPAAWVAGAFLPSIVGGQAGHADHADGPASIRVALIQTNLPQAIRGGWPVEERLESWRDWRVMLSDAAAGRDKPPPNLIVFPETMFPGRVLQEDAARIERENRMAWVVPMGDDGEDVQVEAWVLRDDLLRIQRESGVPVLIGAPRFEGFEIRESADGFFYDYDRYFNSVFLIREGRVAEPAYDKQHLTPFGEVMPYISAWPWLEARLLDFAARGMRFDVEQGERPRVFEIGTDGGHTARVVSPICFEATMPAVCRRLVFEGRARRAGLMVNVTNDGWFYNAAGGREVHQLAARWRCVELATPMVRSANTGVSSAIDRTGRVARALPPFEPGVLVTEVKQGRGATAYAAVGDSLAAICLIGAILGVSASYRGRASGRATDGFRTSRTDQDDKPEQHRRDSGIAARPAADTPNRIDHDKPDHDKPDQDKPAGD